MSVQAVPKTESDAMIERLLALDAAPSRTQLVTQNPGAAWDEIVKTLTDKVWQEVRIDTHRAKRLADAALNVAQTLGNPSLIARSFRAKANAMYALDEHGEELRLEGADGTRAEPFNCTRRQSLCLSEPGKKLSSPGL